MFQTVGGGWRQFTWESCDNKKNAINVEDISRAATLLTGHCAGKVQLGKSNIER